MGDNDQTQGDDQTQTGSGADEQQTDQSGATDQADGTQQHSQPPATQAKSVQIKLTQEQIDHLLKDGTLDMSDDLFTGAVRERSVLTKWEGTGDQLRQISELATVLSNWSCLNCSRHEC